MRPFRFAVSARTTESVTDLVELTTKAEDLGFDTVAISDHLDNQLAPVVGLAAAAAATSTINLATLVLANDFRHPAVLAKEIATLDQIAGGRVEFGIGAGWMTTDYEQSGIPLDRPSVRIARLGEAIQILKPALAGETVSFAGDHYQVTDFVNDAPAPSQAGGPPLMVAGGARKILTLAGSVADIVGVNPSLNAGVIDERAGSSATPNATDEKIGWIRAAAGDRFDEIELHTRLHMVLLTDDREAMAAELAPALGVSPSNALDSPHVLAGTVQQCVESLHMWRERWGITYIAASDESIDDLAMVMNAL